jgi:hypothetical protein
MMALVKAGNLQKTLMNIDVQAAFWGLAALIALIIEVTHRTFYLVETALQIIKSGNQGAKAATAGAGSYSSGSSSAR